MEPPCTLWDSGRTGSRPGGVGQHSVVTSRS
jgi:hypothetical protein